MWLTVLRRPGSAFARRPLLLATVTAVASISPLFLVGAQAVQIGSELGLSPASLGRAVALFFGLTALSSATLGRAVQHWGARRSLVATMVGSTIALVSAALSQSVVHLALSMAVGGLANGAVHPSTNLLLVSNGDAPLGTSLGVKQAAPTVASLFAGLAVPVVALTVGWRWSFVTAAVVSLFLVYAVRMAPAPAGHETAGLSGRRATSIDGRLLLVVAVVSGCGGAAGNSLGTFLVDYGVRAVGLAEAAAGLAFALASVAGFTGRVAAGWLMDHTSRPGPLPLAGGLLLAGAVGHVLIGTGAPAGYVVGSLVAYGLGWAWPSLLHYAVVVGSPGGAARATGVLMTGFATGACLGPLVLGQLAHGLGYAAIWLVAAGSSALAGAALCVALRLRRSP
ncbi:MAG: MFS transporter [Streptosporangiales bacterium]|nr:MFS transporter [Streptosporangiales bacterium]